MISLEEVSKFVLSDVSIYIPQGKTVGLIGASGAGKTTFMKIVCGLLVPDKGSVNTMGYKPIPQPKCFCKEIGVLMADVPLLQREDTIEGNFKMLKNIYGIPEEIFARDYKELSERLGFAGFESRPVKELSLGQRRRGEIGAVMLHRPQLLLMDEPTNGLDENGKQSFYELVEERKKDGLTILLTSHNMEEVSRVCDRIALLEAGKLLYYGEEELLRKRFAPVHTIILEVEGKIPDLEDLPVLKYMVDGSKLQMVYNSNHITAAEILQLVLSQTAIKEVKIHKPDLRDIIVRLSTERMNKYG